MLHMPSCRPLANVPSHPLHTHTQHVNTHVTTNADTWRAPIAATVLGPLMVLTFNILSCVILIRWEWEGRGGDWAGPIAVTVLGPLMTVLTLYILSCVSGAVGGRNRAGQGIGKFVGLQAKSLGYLGIAV